MGETSKKANKFREWKENKTREKKGEETIFYFPSGTFSLPLIKNQGGKQSGDHYMHMKWKDDLKWCIQKQEIE